MDKSIHESEKKVPSIGAKLLNDIKNHVVQIENMILAAILFTAVLSLKPALEKLIGPDISFLFPFVFLAIMPIFVRVTNPPSKLRSILTWGSSGAGIGGTVGGGLAGAVSGGLGAPAGALIGAPIGFCIGAYIGTIVDKTPDVLTQGEAREFIFKLRKMYPSLDMRTIVDATEHPPVRNDCYIYMFLSDGIIKCTKQDVLNWLKRKCWNKGPYRDREEPHSSPLPHHRTYGSPSAGSGQAHLGGSADLAESDPGEDKPK